MKEVKAAVSRNSSLEYGTKDSRQGLVTLLSPGLNGDKQAGLTSVTVRHSTDGPKETKPDSFIRVKPGMTLAHCIGAGGMLLVQCHAYPRL